MTNQEIKTIQDRLEQVIPNPKCNLCGSDSLGMVSPGIVPLLFKSNHTEPENSLNEMIPCLNLICQNCGDVHLISLMQLGGLDDLCSQIKW